MTKKKNGKKNGMDKTESGEGQPVVSVPPPQSLVKMDQHGVQISDMDSLQRFCRMAHASGFFGTRATGEALTREIAQACVKIEYGLELGLKPINALMSVYTVDGKPSLSSGAIGALIKASGKYTYTAQTSKTACTIEWYERYRGEREHLGTSEFTIEDAKTAGLAGRNPWKKYTKAMLFARALTQGARMFCQDVFLGAVYTPEELSDGEVIDADLMPAAPERKPINKPGEMFNDD